MKYFSPTCQRPRTTSTRRHRRPTGRSVAWKAPRRYEARRRPRGLAALALLLMGGVLLIASMAPLALGLLEHVRYMTLAQSLHSPDDRQAPKCPAPSRPRLPEGVDAWVRVEGTPIDYPVAWADEEDPALHLDHDPWGAPSWLGCPFVDARCHPNSLHLLVYGHHFAGTPLMFSCLHDVYEERRFEELGGGELVWTDAGGESRLQALCALRVTSDYPNVQRFDLEDQPALASFLAGMCAAASARHPDSATLCSHARRAITLATCSSLSSGQPWRTLVVFCETGWAPSRPDGGPRGE